MLEIIKYPNKILRQRSRNVTNYQNSEIQHFIEKLVEIMILKEGLGLSAPQVGQNINLITIRLVKGSKVFINPKILWKSWFKKSIVEEGCLSFPDIFGLVKRPKVIWVKYRDRKSKLRITKFQGLLATVVQHEIDHLRGKLFIDKIFKYTKGENKLIELQKVTKLDEK